MTAQILPERFSDGDFATWLRHFDRCASANAWNDEKRLAKLPAFLHGPAAMYFDSLAATDKDTLPHLLDSLTKCFTPMANREQFYREFEQQALRPTEDPSLYLWRLKDLLRRAEPDLSADAFDALLRRQFMKGLPLTLRIKLLESDPTPNLAKMVSLAQRFRALDDLPTDPPAQCAAVHQNMPDSPVVPEPSHEQQQQRLNHLERLISKMADQQANLVATVSALPLISPAPVAPNTVSFSTKNGVRCFFCHEEGHVVRQCKKRQGASRCTACGGWGHSAQNCSTLFPMDCNQYYLQGRKSLNYQRVPR